MFHQHLLLGFDDGCHELTSTGSSSNKPYGTMRHIIAVVRIAASAAAIISL